MEDHVADANLAMVYEIEEHVVSGGPLFVS